VALWSRVIMDVDYSNYPDITIDITGKWERSSKNGTGFGAAEILMPQAIVSSNSVTAGEGYKHCITCFVGASDSGTDTEILAKYSTRNDYPEGDLYYRRDAWQ